MPVNAPNDNLDLLAPSFNLKNIGTFKILNKKERIGRNPRTKEIYKIKARKTLAFKPSTNLSRKINI